MSASCRPTVARFPCAEDGLHVAAAGDREKHVSQGCVTSWWPSQAAPAVVRCATTQTRLAPRPQPLKLHIAEMRNFSDRGSSGTVRLTTLQNAGNRGQGGWGRAQRCPRNWGLGLRLGSAASHPDLRQQFATLRSRPGTTDPLRRIPLQQPPQGDDCQACSQLRQSPAPTWHPPPSRNRRYWRP